MSQEIPYSLVLKQLNTGVLLLDLDKNIVMWNNFFDVHTNKNLSHSTGQSIFTIFPELPKRWVERKLDSILQLKTPSFCSWEQRHHLFELSHSREITTDSHFMAQNCSFLPIINNGILENICILIEDVTDICYYQQQLQNTLTKLALANRVDGLTQIYNRKFWEESLAIEYARTRRHNHNLSLIIFDLDYFKLFNDKYGHQCGDSVLIKTAEIISNVLRTGDVFGRYGGEEFSVILPETNLTGAADVAERIREAIAESCIHYQGKDLKYSVSVGVAELLSTDKSYETLIYHADVALYKAKSLGRNIVVLQ